MRDDRGGSGDPGGSLSRSYGDDTAADSSSPAEAERRRRRTTLTDLRWVVSALRNGQFGFVGPSQWCSGFFYRPVKSRNRRVRAFSLPPGLPLHISQSNSNRSALQLYASGYIITALTRFSGGAKRAPVRQFTPTNKHFLLWFPCNWVLRGNLAIKINH